MLPKRLKAYEARFAETGIFWLKRSAFVMATKADYQMNPGGKGMCWPIAFNDGHCSRNYFSLGMNMSSILVKPSSTAFLKSSLVFL